VTGGEGSAVFEVEQDQGLNEFAAVAEALQLAKAERGGHRDR
jgi:hypothetical protein